MSCCWLILYGITGTENYREAACRVNSFLRRTIAVEGPPGTRSALKGSFPLYREYCRYQYPNWATKFLIDANILELAAELPVAAEVRGEPAYATQAACLHV